MEFKGKHYLASFYDCENLEKVEYLKKSLKTALECSHCTIIGSEDYVFENQGMTAVFLLSESHCSIHTYPEYRSVFIDLFTCGDTADTLLFHEELINIFQTLNVKYQILSRE
jgi:S-adenosylmethionine decarboxylase proenzyme